MTDRVSERNRLWAATMEGYGDDSITRAHRDSVAQIAAAVGPEGFRRADREAEQDHLLAPGATRSHGGGNRAVEEAPDDFRTCFERDRDRILHSNSFRRLAGKTQVFIFPDDHQRTRLTHALEVAQVAGGVARATGLNVALAEAIAIGHDCGHGPAGHASEEAFDKFVPGGFDHAPWGADVSLRGLNLCLETLDGIRNHSWSRPAPSTPEGEVVSWADRIAYVCHDFEDAVSAGIVREDQLPDIVAERCGRRRGQQLGAFINAMIRTIQRTGIIGMDAPFAEALAAFRTFNYENIYLRDASRDHAHVVVDMLTDLVEYFAQHSNEIPNVAERGGLKDDDPVMESVAYVAGMTDRFACRQAVAVLGWEPSRLPRGIND